MRKANVFRNSRSMGKLIEDDNGHYTFEYLDDYFENKELPAVSLTMPKTKKVYKSSTLFPFFFNILSEGSNKKVQLRQFQIDENDHFGLLLATCSNDTIGAIIIKEEKSNT